MTEFDLDLDDGRRLHAYDTGAGESDDRLAVFWHHGTPNIGAPPEPLFPAAERLGIRWVSYDRPGYGGSTRRPGRDVASAVPDAVAVADALGIERFAVMGHSSGAVHALASGALLPDRVLAVAAAAPLAPRDAEGLDWFAGMAASGAATLRAAAEGIEDKERYMASGAAYDPEWTPADEAAYAGDWSWFVKVVGPALEGGPGGEVDDDIALVSPWGFDPAAIVAPVLFLHGEGDRVAPSAHGRWLANRTPSSELRLRPGDGHISILTSADSALDWLATQAR